MRPYKKIKLMVNEWGISSFYHTMPLEDVKEVYDIFVQKKDNTIKVILKPQ